MVKAIDHFLFPACSGTYWRTLTGDALVGGLFSAAGFLAWPLAKLDGMLRPGKTARVRAAFSEAHRGWTDGSSELRAIWFARVAREGLRLLIAAGFERAVLARIVVTGNKSSLPENCVFAIYHSPWGRVLARWLSLQPRSVLLATGRWAERAPGAQLPCTWRGIRRLVEQLRAGASAAVTLDHFGRGSHAARASLLGRYVDVSSGAARIAATAGVPIVPVMTRYVNGMLEIAVGGKIFVAKDRTVQVTRALIAHFDAQLRNDPSSWADTHQFLAQGAR